MNFGYPQDAFVRPVRPGLICGICLEVLKNPKQCRKGHCFCNECFLKELGLRSKCPVCQDTVTVDDLVSNILVRDMVGELDLKCSNHNTCQWIGVVDQLDHHMKHQCVVECPLGALCSNSNCKVRLSDRLDHVIQYFVSTTPPEVRNKFKQIVSTCGHHLYGELDNANHLKGHGIILETDLSYFHAGFFQNSSFLHGIGFCKFSNGDVYRGNYKGGYFHGEGELIFASGDSYNGNWANDLRTGHGTYNWKSTSGDVYSGNFENGTICGNGTLTQKSGEIHSGEWKKGLIRHGPGRQTTNYGTVYEGNWIENKKNGAFLISKPFHATNSAIFENDLKHGLCTTTQNNGYVMRYENYQNGKLHGNSLIVDKTTGEINSTEYSEGLKHGHEKHIVSGKCAKLLHWSQGKLVSTELVSGGWLDAMCVFIGNMCSSSANY